MMGEQDWMLKPAPENSLNVEFMILRLLEYVVTWAMPVNDVFSIRPMDPARYVTQTTDGCSGADALNGVTRTLRILRPAFLISMLVLHFVVPKISSSTPSNSSMAP
jgi:hypothetical protein